MPKSRAVFLIAVVLAFLISSRGGAADFVVNSIDETADSDTGDGFCDADSSGDNNGPCTLRAALEQINASADADNTITFDPVVFPAFVLKTINHTTDLPLAEVNLALTAPGSNRLKITGTGLGCDDGAPGTGITCSFSGFTQDGLGTTARGMTAGGPMETVHLTDVVFMNNTAGGVEGAGVFTDGATVTLSDCAILDNTADEFGGGLAIRETAGTAAVTITGCTVSGNTVADGSNATDALGGGIFNEGGNLTVTDTAVTANQVDLDGATNENGGGIYNAGGGLLAIERSTFFNNKAIEGGGLFNTGNDSSVFLVNVTVSGNHATGAGGGIRNTAGPSNTMAIQNATIVSNVSDGDGGGLSVGAGAGNTVTIANTILANNNATGMGPDCNASSNLLVSANFNLVENTANCVFALQSNDQTGSDPQLGSIFPFAGGDPFNGTPTGVHEPGPLSPAIDAGPDDPAEFPALDQRGTSRPLGIASDIGAVETGCGDGIAQLGEDCDDFAESPYCDDDCTDVVCGDGNTNEAAGETCDDGNAVAGDGCSATCVQEVIFDGCGDGNLDPGEECDDGNLVNGDGCSASCTDEVVAACGDGILQAPEDCDDGNTVSGDGCSAFCQEEFDGCGDGNLDPGEECDDDNLVNGDGCSSTCMNETEPACGDGILQAGESCEDGNTVNGDGCNDRCEFEHDSGGGCSLIR